MRPTPTSEREVLDEIEAGFDQHGPDDDADGFGDDSFLTPREDLARRPIKVTPQLRQLSKRQQTLCAHAEPSWWTKPDANWPAEQQRMRENPKAPRIPSQNAIIGWKAVF